MMQSIYNQADLDSLIQRINSLDAGAKPVWGKMNVGQMLAHSQKPLDVVFGELKLKRGLIGVLFGGIARRSMSGDKPFKKNLPTAPAFVVKDEREVEHEKKELIRKLDKFVSIRKDSLEAIVHPFFGKMKHQEWDRLMWKHLDHHLKQFGV
jgi:hypothetical protein